MKANDKMSKIEQLLPEDHTIPSVNDTPPEQVEAEAKAEQAEAEQANALWSATTTLKPYLWEVNIVLNAVRYSGLLLSEDEPDHRRAVALIATIYGMDVSLLLNAVLAGHATVLSQKPHIYDDDDIKNNYTPF